MNALHNQLHCNKNNFLRRQPIVLNIRLARGPQHPYDKWVTVRGEIAEAAIGRMTLIKAIADFIKDVLPDATLTQDVATPKRESVEFGTHTVQNLATTPR
jgi:hypothetical protein